MRRRRCCASSCVRGARFGGEGRDALERARAVQRSVILDAIADWSPREQRVFAELMDRFVWRFVAFALDECADGNRLLEG